MTISKKGLWIIISILLLMLLGQSYICRGKIIETSFYYKNRIISFYDKCKKRKKAHATLAKFISSGIRPKSIVIFEPNAWHHECMPGYAKYFTDLGYNVDVLIQTKCEDSLDLFEPKDKLRIFYFDDLDQIDYLSSDISCKFDQYDHVLLHTTDLDKKALIEELGLLSNPKSFFVAHDTEFMNDIGIGDYYNKNRIFVLGDFKKGLYINPNYFGEIPTHTKNKKTRFFITSTVGRDYSSLIESVRELKSSNMDFEILVVGRSNTLSKEIIPADLLNYFIFKCNIPYKEMYDEAQKCDYILMLLEPQNDYDNVFKTRRATGTAQLAYGFSKPTIVQEDFADFYKFTSQSAFIYGKNKNLTNVMSEAIKMTSEEYSKKSSCVTSLAKAIYKTSLNNLIKALNSAG